MSDEKDPVMEQIERDAKELALAIYPNVNSLIHGTYNMGILDGALNQDPIAWNRCLDEVIKLVNDNPGFFYQFKDEFISELEKKRR